MRTFKKDKKGRGNLADLTLDVNIKKIGEFLNQKSEKNDMAQTQSKMLPLGTVAPSFRLKGTDKKIINFEESQGKLGYLVMFICNHCPFVKHIRSQLAKLTSEYIEKRIGVFGINSNDIVNYPEDDFSNMINEKKQQNYLFDYLLDETQNVAKAYQAACTPDFFLFNSNKKLVYRGQFDDSRPGNKIPVTGNDLKLAMDAILNRAPVSQNQKPSIGCNIKWKN